METVSAKFDVSMETVLHTIICKELKMRKICAKFVLSEDHKKRLCNDSREMVELINSSVY